MTDWKFGDVLRRPQSSNPIRVMVIACDPHDIGWHVVFGLLPKDEIPDFDRGYANDVYDDVSPLRAKDDWWVLADD